LIRWGRISPLWEAWSRGDCRSSRNGFVRCIHGLPAGRSRHPLRLIPPWDRCPADLPDGGICVKTATPLARQSPQSHCIRYLFPLRAGRLKGLSRGTSQPFEANASRVKASWAPGLVPSGSPEEGEFPGPPFQTSRRRLFTGMCRELQEPRKAHCFVATCQCR
jgi:hypothetical protein